MKTIRIIGAGLAASLVVLMLLAACSDPLSKPVGNSAKVTIRLAGANGRTVLPSQPVFSRFDLSLQEVVVSDENETPVGDPINVPNTAGLQNNGVTVSLTEGTWRITLKAFQELNGQEYLVSTGYATIEVREGVGSKIYVDIVLDPVMEAEPGVFSYTVTLPAGVNTAVLSLKDGDGDEVFEDGDVLDLTIAGNLSGSIDLVPGYYDLSVILTKNGQSAGAFESVHIYSGLESRIDLNLSDVQFADQVYLAGTLGGIRLGTVKITNGSGETLGTLELDSTPAVRSANWIIAIPSEWVGKTVYIVQNYISSSSSIVSIPSVPANGKTGLELTINPDTPASFNVVQWYSELTATGTANDSNLAQVADGSAGTYWQSVRSTPEEGEEEGGDVWLEVNFGFPVTVNASRLIFYANSVDKSVLIQRYRVQYDNGGGWVTSVNRRQSFSGSTDASVEYSNFFTQITAPKFRWLVPGSDVSEAPALVEFGLYLTPDRGALTTAIPLAQSNHDNSQDLPNGAALADLSNKIWWATVNVRQTYQAAIRAAEAVRDNVLSTSEQISVALSTLNGATTAFDNAKKRGELNNILMSEVTVQDGYANKFVITWLREPTYTYELNMSSTGSGGWTKIAEFDEWEDATEAQMYTYTVTGIGAGQTRYFKMQAFGYEEGEKTSGTSKESGAKYTLGTPALTLLSAPNSSYRTVTLSWTTAQMADAYRIVYSFAGYPDSHTTEAAISELTPIEGGYTYTLLPNKYNDPQITGRLMTIHVEAQNNALYQASGCERVDITTTSGQVQTRLVGPALINASATQATSANTIALSWDSIAGANGYYVFRRQFNMNNTAQEVAAIAYYVPAGSGTLTVTGKSMAAGNADTTTTKATVAVAGNRYTLTDTWMIDSEYSGSPYNGYAANYKNQQNDIARGNAYRYFIVPVIASTDTVTFTPNGNSVTYTLTDGSGPIAYIDGATLEKTGFTYGFGQNVTATKGSYVSSGDVNNGIQITWSAPPLRTGTLQYTLYRKASNGNWEQVTTLNETSYVSNAETRGIVYEYAVGINGSQPHTLGRFITDSRAPVNAKGIPNVYGFMLEMQKLQSVSRDQRTEGGQFAEDITLIKNADQNYIKGIDGYTVYVMNRNLNGNWHTIRENVAASGVDATIRVTTGMASYSFTSTGNSLNFDLLRVMRDYKHYFKVRSFVMNGSTRVYCPDPSYTYSSSVSGSGTNSITGSAETEYVKWGARQITADEFITIATLYMANGLKLRFGTGSWPTNYGYMRWSDAGGGGCSGSIGSESNFGVNSWTLKFENFRDDLTVRAGEWALFVTVNGTLWAGTGASNQHPRKYGDLGWINIIGPSDTPALYTGQLRIGGSDYTDMEFDNNGTVRLIYPAGTAQQNLTRRGRDSPFPYHNQGGDRLNLEDYK